MSKVTQIQSRIQQINPAVFQQLCDAYIYKKFSFQRIKAIGTVIGKEKTRIGTPDTAFQNANEKFVFAEYTTQEESVTSKFLEDVEKCFDENKTGVSVSQIEAIFLCHNGRLSIEEEETLRNKGKEKGINVEIIDLDTLSFDLFSRYPQLAKDFLNVEVDTGQILDTQDFIKEYQKSPFATRLDTRFYFREEEIKTIVEGLNTADLIIITGKAGVGKSRLALEAIYNFKKENPDFNDYSIFNKQGISLFNDIRDYFSDDKNFIIFVDDANRVSELQHILRLLTENSENKKIKIIITVRDYAENIIFELSKDYSSTIIDLKPFDNKQLRQFISEEFKITNAIYLERIERISGGNPRIAVMAASIAKKANRLESIFNVEGIYNEYFSSISKDLESLEGQNLLKVAGIISFFRVIKLDDTKLITKIEESFGIKPEELFDCIIQLHKMEVIELYENEVAKISDQILATFLFYKSFFKENNLLNFATLLRDFFESHRNLFLEAIYPSFDIFDRDLLRKKIQPCVDEKWEQIKDDDEKILSFIKAFFPFKETESILYLKKKIDSLKSENHDFTKISLKPEKSNHLSDEYLKIIQLFRQASLESFQNIIELLFIYLEKRPSLLPQFIYLFIEEFCFERHSDWNNYIYETAFVESLIQKLRDSDKKEIYQRIFISVAEKFLGMRFQSEESKGMSVTIYTFVLRDCVKVNNLRKSLWEGLFFLYEQEGYQPTILEIISNYSYNWRPDENNKEVAKKDAELIIPFIEEKLNPNLYEHCNVAQDYFFYLEKLEIPFDESLKHKFTSKVYKIAEIVLDKNLRIYQAKGFENTDSKQLELIKEEIGEYSLENLTSLFEIFLQIAKNDPEERDFYKLDTIVSNLLSDLANENKVLFKEVVQHIIKSGNLLKIGKLGGLYKIIRNFIDVENNPKEVYKFLNSNEYNLKEIWIYGFLLSLKRDEIDNYFLEQLYKFYEFSQIMSVDLDYLEHYAHLDSEITINIVKIIWQRIMSSDFRFNFFYLLHGDRKHDLNKIFHNDLSLLKEIYFYQQELNQNDDYDRSIFKEIYKMDTNFAVEYIEWLYGKNDYLSAYDKGKDFSFIWENQNYEKQMNEILDLAYNKSKEHHLYFYRTYPEIYFGNYDGETNEKIKSFLCGYIKENIQDFEKVSFVFRMISDLPNLQIQIIDFLSVFLEHNKNYNDFSKLPIDSFHKSWSGSRVPMFEKDIQFYRSILPLLKGLEFAEHRNKIEKVIINIEKQIQEELKNEFLESAFM